MSNDTIYRQDAVDAINELHDKPNAWLDLAVEALENLPSAETERKNGKWIGKEQFANSPEFYSWQCSVCGCVLEDPTLGEPYPFCPRCGSFNGGEEDEN